MLCHRIDHCTLSNTNVSHINVINSGGQRVYTSWNVRWTAPLTGSTPLQLFIAGNAVNGMDGNSGDLWNFGIINQVPLPVKFVSFDAKAKDNLVNLNWEISSQVNASLFEMTRSSDGNDFETIGSLKVTDKSVYSFQDGKPLMGINYYQIRQIDIDGQVQYSKIVSQASYDGDIRVYPSVVDNGEIHVDELKDQNLNFKLVGINGNVVFRTMLDEIKSTVDVSHIAEGIYIIVIESKANIVLKTQKIVISM